MTQVLLSRQTPPNSGAVTDTEWQRWFQDVYDTTMQDGLTTDKWNLVGKTRNATASNEMLEQDLIKWNVGHYVDYYSKSGNIAYGFAAAVRRQSGSNLTVGAQLDAISNAPDALGLFGCAIEAIGDQNFVSPIVGLESTAACLYGNNESAKWAFNPVFKDRADGQANVLYAIGNDRFNYFAHAIVVTSQSRSGTGEHCGFNSGLMFSGDCLDGVNAPNWSASVTYQPGMMVISGGRSWKAVLPSLNQAPAVPSNYWVWTSPVGTATDAVGIDFVPMSLTAQGRMASAIRLRDFMRIHWEVTGTIGTYFDSTNARHVLTDQAGTAIFSIGVAAPAGAGVPDINQVGIVAAGAGCTLAGAGGPPNVAAQAGWVTFRLAGTPIYIPFWQ